MHHLIRDKNKAYQMGCLSCQANLNRDWSLFHAFTPLYATNSSHFTFMQHVNGAVGAAGELEAETLALLEMEAVSSADFSPEVLGCLPQNLPWSISEQDRSYRRDFTGIRCSYLDSDAVCFDLYMSLCLKASIK